MVQHISGLTAKIWSIFQWLGGSILFMLMVVIPGMMTQVWHSKVKIRILTRTRRSWRSLRRWRGFTKVTIKFRVLDEFGELGELELVFTLFLSHVSYSHIVMQKENQSILAMWQYPAQEEQPRDKPHVWVFTGKHLRPGQVDLCGKAQSEMIDSCFTTVGDYSNYISESIWTFPGVWSSWVIDDDVSNGGAYIESKSKGLINIPETGWKYINGGTFHDDDTMRVTSSAGHLSTPNKALTLLLCYFLSGSIDWFETKIENCRKYFFIHISFYTTDSGDKVGFIAVFPLIYLVFSLLRFSLWLAEKMQKEGCPLQKYTGTRPGLLSLLLLYHHVQPLFLLETLTTPSLSLVRKSISV